MITRVTFRTDKGRIYADIVRDSIVDGEKVYIGNGQHPKYLPQGLSTTIDLTAYMKAELTGNLRSLLNGIASGDVRYYNRYDLTVRPQIEREDGRIDQDYSAYFDGVKTDCFGLLTLLPYMQIAEGDSVIVCAQCADDDCNSVSVGNTTSVSFSTIDHGVVVTSLTPTTTAKNIVLNSSTGYDNDYRNTIPLRTIPKGMNTRRLLWRNELGGIDSWYFEFLRESNYATSSEVFYSTANGYTRTNRKSERLHTVETRELDDITAEVVAYILASPEVYLVEGNNLVPIDVVTEECRTYSDTELSGVQVSYRKRMRE